jgi:hypothetical protein
MLRWVFVFLFLGVLGMSVVCPVGVGKTTRKYKNQPAICLPAAAISGYADDDGTPVIEDQPIET